jgi:hypothetical protein
MQETLRRFPSSAVVIELHLDRAAGEVQQLVAELREAGKPIRRVADDGRLVLVSGAEIRQAEGQHWTQRFQVPNGSCKWSSIFRLPGALISDHCFQATICNTSLLHTREITRFARDIIAGLHREVKSDWWNSSVPES